ncbi:hypothetical protein ACFQGW_00590 [Xanthomonas theicola]|uniref:hypothetical protein n=1 Tax=Xanthomonas theicola TaxID=56464 RepID=UPI00361AE37E
MAALVLLSGLSLAALSAWARGYDPGHPAQLVASVVPGLACSAALPATLPVLLIGHFIGRRRARRTMPTHITARA